MTDEQLYSNKFPTRL